MGNLTRSAEGFSPAEEARMRVVLQKAIDELPLELPGRKCVMVRFLGSKERIAVVQKWFNGEVNRAGYGNLLSIRVSEPLPTKGTSPAPVTSAGGRKTGDFDQKAASWLESPRGRADDTNHDLPGIADTDELPILVHPRTGDDNTPPKAPEGAGTAEEQQGGTQGAARRILARYLAEKKRRQTS